MQSRGKTHGFTMLTGVFSRRSPQIGQKGDNHGPVWNVTNRVIGCGLVPLFLASGNKTGWFRKSKYRVRNET